MKRFITLALFLSAAFALCLFSCASQDNGREAPAQTPQEEGEEPKEEQKEEVKQLISDKTGLKASSFDVFVIEAIPRFESGKINYRKLN